MNSNDNKTNRQGFDYTLQIQVYSSPISISEDNRKNDLSNSLTGYKGKIARQVLYVEMRILRVIQGRASTAMNCNTDHESRNWSNGRLTKCEPLSIVTSVGE